MANINVDTLVKLPRIQKIAILAGIAVLLIGLYWFLLYRGQAEKLADKRAVLTKKQQELNEQKMILANLPKFRQETQEMKVKRQEALKQLPNKKDIDKLLKDVSSNAVESGLEVLLFKPEKEVKKNFYAEIPVELKLTGSYHDLGLFYDRVANFPRIVNITDIEIDKAKSKSKDSSGKNVLQASCTAKTYKFIEEQAGGEAKKNGKKKKKKK
jgi:type IV pilus assembly protein PilO